MRRVVCRELSDLFCLAKGENQGKGYKLEREVSQLNIRRRSVKVKDGAGCPKKS